MNHRHSKTMSRQILLTSVFQENFSNQLPFHVRGLDYKTLYGGKEMLRYCEPMCLSVPASLILVYYLRARMQNKMHSSSAATFGVAKFVIIIAIWSNFAVSLSPA
jgi:hypothetical protein